MSTDDRQRPLPFTNQDNQHLVLVVVIPAT